MRFGVPWPRPTWLPPLSQGSFGPRPFSHLSPGDLERLQKQKDDEENATSCLFNGHWGDALVPLPWKFKGAWCRSQFRLCLVFQCAMAAASMWLLSVHPVPRRTPSHLWHTRP